MTGKDIKKLRVGVAGCGFISKKRHIPAFLRLKKDVCIAAVCDLDQKLAIEASKQFSIPHVYSNVSEMLSDEKLDIVDVCTPPKTHSSVALEAMNNGCNVIIEKPMASTLEECDRMIEVSKENNVRLGVMHNQNFYRPFIKARELVRNGAIGELIGMRVLILTTRDEYISNQNHWIHKLSGGPIGETGPHAVYMSLAFLNNVTEVFVCARKQTTYPWVTFDDYRIELVGRNITSSIHVSHAGNNNASEVNVFGTNGSINIDLQSMLLTRSWRKRIDPASVASTSLSTASQMMKGVFSNVLNVSIGKSMLGHDVLIEKFVQSIIHNQPTPVTPEEGRETIRVMEMIVKSIQSVKVFS